MKKIFIAAAIAASMGASTAFATEVDSADVLAFQDVESLTLASSELETTAGAVSSPSAGKLSGFPM